MLKDTNKASNATFKMLAAGTFLGTTITDVNSHVLLANIDRRAKDELKSFKGIFHLFKDYLKGFNQLRVGSNRKSDSIDAKAKRVSDYKMKKLGIEYDENHDLQEGYWTAAGDINDFMNAWIRSGKSNNRDELMDLIKNFE